MSSQHGVTPLIYWAALYVSCVSCTDLFNNDDGQAEHNMIRRVRSSSNTGTNSANKQTFFSRDQDQSLDFQFQMRLQQLRKFGEEKILDISHVDSMPDIMPEGQPRREGRGLEQARERGQMDSETQGPTDAMLFTQIYPTDTLPIELMLPHQMHMLTSSPESISRVFVIENRPPGWSGGDVQSSGIQKLRQQMIKPIPVDYTLCHDDHDFLHRFFTGSSPPLRFIQESCGKASFSDAQFHEDIRLYTNMMGMLTFLAHCLDADSAASLCVYLDPDVFLWRGSKGIIDLAPSIFSQHPHIVSFQPPNPSSSPDWGDTTSDICQMEDVGFASSRYMVINRTRLSAILPLDSGPGPFTPMNLFENAFSNAHPKLGKLMCSGETFAIHPPGRFGDESKMNIGSLLSNLHQASHEHRRATGALSLRQKEPSVDGVKLLIEHINAGKFERSATDNNNEDMVPSMERIMAGFAW